MGGISSGVGIFSGIDTARLIERLLAIEARPKVLAQTRISQLATQQAAFLDINTRLGTMRSSAAALRTGNIFDSLTAVSSNPDVLTAVASTGAVPGNYDFIVHRLVSSQQYLSRGFADSSSTGLNAGSFTFETALGRVDRETALADLNGGTGIERGKILIEQQGGGSAEIDLSRVATVGEVLDAINNALGVSVSARVEGDHFVVEGSGGDIRISSLGGRKTSETLGIRQATYTGVVTGTRVYALSDDTAITSLNDGNGIFINQLVGDPSSVYDFTLVIDAGSGAQTVKVNLGRVYDSEFKVVKSEVRTVGEALERINTALDGAGFTAIRATIDATAGGIRIANSGGAATIRVEENTASAGNTAADLGLTTGTVFNDVVAGKRVLAGMNTTLAKLVNGGAGVAGDGTIAFTARDATAFTADISGAQTVREIISAINNATGNGGRIVASLDSTGTGLLITDTTGGSANLIITGQTAESLGIHTDPGGIAKSTRDGNNLQHQYVASSTLLASLNGGKGIGTGIFRITDGFGASAEIDIGTDSRTIIDVIKEINSQGLAITARINATGDGIEIIENTSGGQGGAAIKIEDVSGTVASRLRIAGTAKGTGADNTIDGSYERVLEFEATDTLADIARKINGAGLGASATVINDGNGSKPFRLSIVATSTGTAGRMVIDTGGFDLGLSTLDAGNDARVFFGSSDPATAVLLSSSTNILDGVIAGVTIDLKGVSEKPVSLTISRDTAKIEEGVKAFVDAFNAAIDRIDFQTRYVQDTNTRGALLGESSMITLRSALYNTVQGRAIGVAGPYDTLAEVGITVGKDGKLELDRDELRDALAQDPDAVRDLFSARKLAKKDEDPNAPDGPDKFEQLGIAAQVEELVDSYVNSVDGVLTEKGRTIDGQISLQRKRIAAFDAKLEVRRQILSAQFLAMEKAISQLRSQQDALASLSFSLMSQVR